MSPSAAELLRSARERSSLSQTDLARRAGVAQSVISAYESARREPSLAMLVRLVAASGHELDIDLVPLPDRALGLPDTPRGRRLRQRRKAVLEAAARRRAHNLRVFGSTARGDDGPSSDIDLLVDLDEGAGVVDLVGLRRELTDLLGVAVDVVPVDGLKPRLRDQVLREAIPL